MLVNHFGELDTKIIVTFIIIIFRSEYRYKQKSAQSRFTERVNFSERITRFIISYRVTDITRRKSNNIFFITIQF